MPTKRSRSTPKQYPNTGTGKSEKSRKLCPTCEKNGIKHYMSLPMKQFRSEKDPTIIVRCKPLWFCDICRTVIWNEEELKKIPK